MNESKRLEILAQAKDISEFAGHSSTAAWLAEPVLGALFSDLLTTVETDRIFAKVRAGEKP